MGSSPLVSRPKFADGRLDAAGLKRGLSSASAAFHDQATDSPHQGEW